MDPELFGYMDDLDPDLEKNPDPEREKNIVPKSRGNPFLSERRLLKRNKKLLSRH